MRRLFAAFAYLTEPSLIGRPLAPCVRSVAKPVKTEGSVTSTHFSVCLNPSATANGENGSTVVWLFLLRRPVRRWPPSGDLDVLLDCRRPTGANPFATPFCWFGRCFVGLRPNNRNGNNDPEGVLPLPLSSAEEDPHDDALLPDGSGLLFRPIGRGRQRKGWQPACLW